MTRFVRLVPVAFTAFALASGRAGAQSRGADPSARLREVLPADVADRVLARIADARARQLPAAAIGNRALKFAARGVAPRDIENSITEQIDRMQQSKAAIELGRGGRADDDEVEAGADLMRKGVDGAQVSALARSAPSGRSLAVPLFVIGSLIDRGLAGDAALQRVESRLATRASDRDLEDLPNAVADSRKPSLTGQDLAATNRPVTSARPSTAGPPETVPRNAGRKAHPGNSGNGRP